MPQIKYYMEFKDYYERTVTVNFLSADFFGLPLQLTGGVDPLIISCQGEDEGIFQAIFTRKATISIILTENDLSFLDDIAILDEDTFGIEILINGGIEFVGWLIPDEQSRTFSYSSQSVTITAVDVISRLKGEKVVQADGKLFYSKTTLEDIVTTCINNGWNQDLVNASPVYLINSSLVLSYDTLDPLGDILGQLAVDPSTFNDDMGRPMNCYDVMKKIANSLCMRVICYQNAIIFHDIPDYVSISSVIPLGYIGHPSGNYETANFVLTNSENINTIRLFKESVSRFEYKGVSGLLIDGYLQNWIVALAGLRLGQWIYSPYLLAQPDVYDRRIGTGRIESPYGIRLYGVTSATPFQYDEIASRTEMIFGTGDTIKINIELKINQNVNAIEPIVSGGSDYRLETWITVVFYNSFDPTDSRALKIVDGVQTWEQKDLTGTSFATGEYDFGAFAPGLPPYIYASINRQRDVQTIEIEAAPIFSNLGFGQIYVSISNAKAYEYTMGNLITQLDTIVYNVIVSLSPKKTQAKATKGDVVYISRFGRASEENAEKNIDLNTTASRGISGSLYAGVSYNEILSGAVITAGDSVYGISKIPFTSGIEKMPLLQYNAMALMAYNYTQYKVDFTAISGILPFSSLISLAGFQDPDRPGPTDIYGEPYIQTRNEYNMKLCQYKITAISMKNTARPLSTDLIDIDHDLLETYSYT